METTETINEIKLVQSPVIEHQLVKVGNEVSKRLDALNLEKQIATEDTISTMKSLRAELNKELESFESQRKQIKTAVLKPYDQLEVDYKTNISEKYVKALELLKTKIGEFETKIKIQKTENITVYFNELCISHKIDFIQFAQLKLDINLTVTEKKYREQINSYIDKVLDDMKLIQSTEYPTESMSEFRTTLNASKAITDVKARKDREKAEADRMKRIETDRRQVVCKNLGMTFLDITNSYEYNDKIFITRSQIENLSKDDFNGVIHQAEINIANAKLEAQANANVAPEQELSTPAAPPVVPNPATPPVQDRTLPTQPTLSLFGGFKGSNIVAPQIAAPVIDAPVKIEKEEVFNATFKVTGTMPQLKSLGVYMRQNAIEYVNVDL